MIIFKISLILILFSSIELFGQNDTFDDDKLKTELLRDKKLILTADSINKLGQIGLLSNDIVQLTETLDKQHPSTFFQKSSAYLGQFQLNEAAFLFYTGYLRYKYYNDANPEYQMGNEGALLASLMASLREPVIRYLKSNVDNYIEILKKSSDWHLNHDYTFFSREKSPEKYVEQIKTIKSMISDLETNKSKRKTEWAIEQDKYLNNLDSTLAQIVKNPAIKKKKPGTQDNKMAEQEGAYINADSLMFCGQKIKAPTDCRMVMPGLVTCDKYVMTWTYESTSEIDRHKREGIAQLKNPKKFDCYILGTKLQAYKSKFETGIQIHAYEIIKGQGLLLSIVILGKDKISTNDDIPEFIRQVFRITKN